MDFKEKNIHKIVEMGHFILSSVSSNDKLSDFENDKIISDFLKTKYFIWNYKLNPNGQNITLTDENGFEKQFDNQKFFGFYETEKLNYSDFYKLSFVEFKSNLEKHISEKATEDFLNKCKEIISKNINISSEFYSIKPPENKIPEIVKEWPVYDYFYSYLNIDKTTNQINLIEFGQD